MSLIDANLDLYIACRAGDAVAVQRAVERGANDWNCGMAWACWSGYRDIIEIMITHGAYGWDLGMAFACNGKQTDIVNMMITRGAGNWNWGMAEACRGGHRVLIDTMIERGASDWNRGMTEACVGGHCTLAIEMLMRGANNTQECVVMVYRNTEFFEFLHTAVTRNVDLTLPDGTPETTVSRLLWCGVGRDRVRGASCSEKILRELDDVKAAVAIPSLPRVLNALIASYFP